MYKKCIAFMMSMILALLPGQLGFAENAETSTNLSLTATASSNYEYPDKNDVSGNAIDGNMDTKWTGKNVNDWWLKIELKKAAEIEKVDLSFSYGTGNMKCYFLEYSDDGEEWKTLEGAYQGRTGSSAPFNNIFIPSKKIITQYIRLTNSVSSPLIYPKINEVAIYGTEIKAPTLSTLAVSGKELSPAFDPDTLRYTCELEADESIPQVTAVGADDVTVAIEQATEETMRAVISVSSNENTELTTQYEIVFTRAESPSGIQNLARKGNVIADPEKNASVVNDGITNKAEYWGNTTTNPQSHLTIQLKHPSMLHQVVVYARSNNNSHHFTMSYSTDGQEWDTFDGSITGSITAENVTFESSSGKKHIYTFNQPTYAKYVRMTNSTQNYLNIVEMEIYGSENAPSAPKLSRLSAGGKELSPAFDPDTLRYICELEAAESIPQVTAVGADDVTVAIEQATEETMRAVISVSLNENTELTTQYEIVFTRAESPSGIQNLARKGNVIADPEQNASVVNDGITNKAEYWSNNKTNPQSHLTIQLKHPSMLHQVVVYARSANNSHHFTMSYSTDGQEWDTFDGNITGSITAENVTFESSSGTLSGKKHIYTFNQPTYAKYVRMTNSTQNYMNIVEMEIYGSEDAPSAPKLSRLSAGDKELSPAFDPDVTQYSCQMEPFEYILPTVTAETGQKDASVIIEQATKQNKKATITVTLNADPDIKTVYTIRFLTSSGGQPESLRLRSLTPSVGTLNPVFDPEKLEYIMEYDVLSGKLPTFEAELEDPSSSLKIVNPTKQNLYATIKVTASTGETINYTVALRSNIAYNKIASATSYYQGNPPSAALDGRMDTNWGASAGTARQYMTVDFGTTAYIEGIQLYEKYTTNKNYHNIIEYSDDNAKWTPLAIKNISLITKTISGLKMHELTYDISPFQTRYIRFSGTQLGKPQITELVVSGYLAKTMSSNAYLSELVVSEGKLTPVFNQYQQDYHVTLPIGAKLPTVDAKVADEGAVLNIEQATPSTMKAIVTVTAENNITTKKYTVYFEQETSPEDNVNLAGISLSAGTLLPQFNPDELQYIVAAPLQGNLPAVTANAVNPDAKVSITQATEDHPEAVILVTSASGKAHRAYTLTMKRMSADLQSLSVEGSTLMPAFDKNITSYQVAMEAGMEIPQIAAVAEDENASVVITPPTANDKNAYVKVNTEEGKLEKIYTLTFVALQTLEEAKLAVLSAVRDIRPSNQSEPEDIVEMIEKLITNPHINIVWTETVTVHKATANRTGNITGKVRLELNGENVVVEINKAIEKLTGSGSGGGGSSGGNYNPVITPPQNTEPTTPNHDNAKDALKRETQGHWAEEEINSLIDRGLVNGSETGLELTNEITRAEFVAMLMRALGMAPTKYNNQFSDVNSSEWFAGYMQTAADMGILQGYEGKVRSNDYVRREEMAKILVSACGKEPKLASDGGSRFVDEHAVSEWALPYVLRAEEDGLVNGFEDGTYRPQENVLREQAMVVIYRMGK